MHDLQHPLPPCTMLCHGNMNKPTCASDTCLHSYGFQLTNRHCMRGKGGDTLLVDMEIAWDTLIHRNLTVCQGLLADIVVLMSRNLQLGYSIRHWDPAGIGSLGPKQILAGQGGCKKLTKISCSSLLISSIITIHHFFNNDRQGSFCLYQLVSTTRYIEGACKIFAL